MPPSTTRSRRRCGQPVPLSTGLSTGSVPGSRPPSADRPRPDSGGTIDVGPGLTGWTAGAHVPGGPTLSSLPLDEWHYMRINEMVCVRSRPARRHACQRAAKRPGRSFRSSTVDIPVGSLSPDLSPRTWLPQPLQTAEPALGAGPASAGQPVGTTQKCQAPKSTPAATTLTSTSSGPNSGRATSRKSSTSADPYLSCTIAFIRPHLIAIQPTAPATVVPRPGPRQSRRSAEEPGPVHRVRSRRLSTLRANAWSSQAVRGPWPRPKNSTTFGRRRAARRAARRARRGGAGYRDPRLPSR